MSKHQQEFDVNLSPDSTMIVCQEAVASLGWLVMDHSQTTMVCKEKAPQVTSFTWPVQIEILLASKSLGITRVTLKGSIFGIGPIQSGHLKGQVGNLRNRIELSVASGTSQQPMYSCPNCNHELAYGIRFCSNCGIQLNWPTQR